jgi:single-strand DNA-binding protein
MLIGNLTRDPELRYTPAGMAVSSFGMATNRVWVTKQGERKEDAQFHRIVAWNKLAELCAQLLNKGRRIYVEGRIQYREIVDAENNKKQIAEIVIDDMILLDNKMGPRNDENTVAPGGMMQPPQETVEGPANEESMPAQQEAPEELGDIVIDEIPETPGDNDKKDEEPAL